MGCARLFQGSEAAECHIASPTGCEVPDKAAAEAAVAKYFKYM